MVECVTLQLELAVVILLTMDQHVNIKLVLKIVTMLDIVACIQALAIVHYFIMETHANITMVIE